MILKLEYEPNEELKDFLLTQKGINDVSIDNEYIKVNCSITPDILLNYLKNKISYYVNLINK